MLVVTYKSIWLMRTLKAKYFFVIDHRARWRTFFENLTKKALTLRKKDSMIHTNTKHICLLC